MNLYGLIGYPLTHSFSKKYFTEKFKKENIANSKYDLFEIDSIGKLDQILKDKDLKGLNVTIPYKEQVHEYILGKGGRIAIKNKNLTAVNVIKVLPDGTLEGHNSDVYGFKKSLMEFMTEGGVNELHNIIQKNEGALVLGNGGAAKAVIAVLEEVGINFKIVTRKENEGDLLYSQIDKSIIDSHKLIINTTPLGTFPQVEEYPNIPYHFLSEGHFLFDLVYNPPVTSFMQKGRDNGAKVGNGHKMLEYQAEKAWEIWNTFD